MNLIYYNDAGEVTAVRSGARYNLEKEHEANDNCILIDGEVPESPYVKDGQVLSRPEPPKPEWFSFDAEQGEWQFNLSASRSAVWSHMKYERDKEEFGTFVWNDHTFDCDETSQRRIQGAVQLASLDTSTVIDWTLADNTVQAFNATELQQIGQALGAHVNACHAKARGLRDQINAATTESEIEAITW